MHPPSLGSLEKAEDSLTVSSLQAKTVKKRVAKRVKSEEILPVFVLLLSILFAFLPSISLAEETLVLTSTEVIQRSLAHNLDLKILELERDGIQSQVMASKAPFDTALSLTLDYTLDKQDVSNTLFGTDNRLTHYNLGLAKKWQTGTETAFKFSNEKLSTNSQFATVSPSYEPAVSFSISQDLWKNYLGVNERRSLKKARLAVEATDLRTQERIYRILHRNLSQYWNFVLAEEALEIARDAEAFARRFLNTTLKKSQMGTVENTDVLAARSQLLMKQNARLAAEVQLANEAEQLRLSLQLEEGEGLSAQERLNGEEKTTSNSTSYEKALQDRVDYRAVKKELASQSLAFDIARTERWPDLTATASLTFNGLAGTYGTALDELNDLDFPTWYVAANLTFPLENRGARSSYHRTKSEKAVAELQLRLLEQDLKREIDERVRTITLLQTQLKNDQTIETLQSKKLEQEEHKYRLGRSSSDLIIRFQDDYTNAKFRRLSTERALRQAWLNLKLAENSLLEGIEIL